MSSLIFLFLCKAARKAAWSLRRWQPPLALMLFSYLPSAPPSPFLVWRFPNIVDKADTTNQLRLSKVTAQTWLVIGCCASACYYCLIWSEAGGGLQSNGEKVLEKVIKSCQRQLSVPGPWLWPWMQMIWNCILVEIQEGPWQGSARHKGSSRLSANNAALYFEPFCLFPPFPEAFCFHDQKYSFSGHILINLGDKVFLSCT